jgi:hypothetical protein
VRYPKRKIRRSIKHLHRGVRSPNTKSRPRVRVEPVAERPKEIKPPTETDNMSTDHSPM